MTAMETGKWALTFGHMRRGGGDSGGRDGCGLVQYGVVEDGLLERPDEPVQGQSDLAAVLVGVRLLRADRKLLKWLSAIYSCFKV